jgi:hypothetical protein
MPFSLPPLMLWPDRRYPFLMLFVFRSLLLTLRDCARARGALQLLSKPDFRLAVYARAGSYTHSRLLGWRFSSILINVFARNGGLRGWGTTGGSRQETSTLRWKIFGSRVRDTSVRETLVGSTARSRPQKGDRGRATRSEPEHVRTA